MSQPQFSLQLFAFEKPWRSSLQTQVEFHLMKNQRAGEAASQGLRTAQTTQRCFLDPVRRWIFEKKTSKRFYATEKKGCFFLNELQTNYEQ